MHPRARRVRWRAPIAAVASLALLAGACGDDPEVAAADDAETQPRDPDATDGDDTADGTDAGPDGDGGEGPPDGQRLRPDAGDDAADGAEDVAVPTAVRIPDTPAGEQLRWLLTAMEPSATIPTASLEERLAPAFTAQVPAAEVATGLTQLGQQGPWIPVLLEGDGQQLQATITASRSLPGAPDRLQVLLTVDDQDRIDALRLVPAPEIAVDDLDDAVAELDALAGHASLLVARIEDDTCVPVAAHEADAPRAVASAAKLYVLLAVTDAVDAGEIGWDDEVELTDTDRSLPSGELQDEPAGTTRTVAELASGMIAISDNTATDHLVTLVGRDAVEDAVVAAGHAEPDLVTPFPRTRELFAVGWDDERRAAWRDADGDVDARRALLDELPPGTGGVEVADVTGTVWTDGVDWTASMQDLCRAHAALDLDEPAVAEAVGTNPGIVLDAEVWSDVAYKGGGAPGVLSLTWSFARDDGDRWFVGIALNDRRQVDEVTGVAVAAATVELLEDLGR
jgi:hypothetical protein